MVDEGNTYEQISTNLKLRYGITRGASPANIRNFCRSYGINSRRNTLTNQQVNTVINAAVRQVSLCVTLLIVDLLPVFVFVSISNLNS